jgi:N-terminal domain on NACHT_NTPase and P-loop NTPases/AAA ATPase domain
MAEAVVAVGLAAAIVQFVAFSAKIISRLDEFVSATNDIPESFRDIRVQLPLIVDTLQRMQAQAENNCIGEAAANVLKAVVDRSSEEAETLMIILDKALPRENTSTFQLQVQALRSLASDKKIQKSIDRLLKNIQVLNFSQSTNSCQNIEKIRQALLKLCSIPTMAASDFSFGLNIGNSPQILDGAFMGRDAELKQLQEWLSPQVTQFPQRVVAVTGMGGLGKTQLSLAFAKRYCGEYTSIFWLNAKDEGTLKQSFVSLSEIIFKRIQSSDMNDALNEEKIIHQIRRWFSQQENGQWLLLFDNYDDAKLPGVNSPTGYDIRRYFPFKTHGSILITTRSRRLKFARELQLRKLDDMEQNLAILSNRSNRSMKDGEPRLGIH